MTRGRWILLLLLIAGLTGAAVLVVRQRAADAAVRSDVAALHKQVEAGYAAAAKLYLNSVLVADAHDNVFTRARAQWAARVRGCDDDPCRRDLLQDQLDRLNFGLGRPGRSRAPIAGLPWKRGNFDVVPNQGFEGGINIFPVIDDTIIVGGEAYGPEVVWECGVVAAGRWNARTREAFLVTLDEDHNGFVIAANRAGGATLRANRGAAEDANVCNYVGSNFGNYRLGAPSSE